MEVLNNVEKISTAKLKTAVKLDWGDAKLRKHLETMPDVEKTKEKNKVYYRLKGKQVANLFSEFG